MGLFDKLFGGKEEDKNSFLDALKDAAEKLKNEAEKAGINLKEDLKNDKKEESGSVTSAEITPLNEVKEGEELAPAGTWWGPLMPDEENQYNFKGSWQEYFDGIFRSEFPEYELLRETVRYGKGIVYRFRKNGETALVVELMSDKSNAQKLRKSLRGTGTPYLRYYYDHEGWWNARAYVVSRTRDALKF